MSECEHTAKENFSPRHGPALTRLSPLTVLEGGPPEEGELIFSPAWDVTVASRGVETDSGLRQPQEAPVYQTPASNSTARLF